MKIIQRVMPSLRKSDVQGFVSSLESRSPMQAVREVMLNQMELIDVWFMVRAEIPGLPAVRTPLAYVVHGLQSVLPAVVESFTNHMLMQTGVGDNVEVFLLATREDEFEKRFPLEAIINAQTEYA